MAKTAHDITTWSGGVANATEPSDAGDEGGSFRIKNLDGTTKIGVLKPCGIMRDYDPTIDERDPIDTFDLSNTTPGQGLDIMPTDFDLGGKSIYSSDGSTNMGIDWSHAGSGSATYSVDGIIVFTAVNDGVTGKLTLDSGYDEALANGTWYQAEFTVQLEATGNWSTGRGELVWCRLDESCYTTTYPNYYLTYIWNDIDISASTGAARTARIVWRSDGDPFALSVQSGSTSAGNAIKVSNFNITKIPSSASLELHYLQNLDSGTSKINIYQDGKNQAGTLGSPYTQVTMGSASAPEINFLRTSNSVRISDGNFANTAPTRFFGLVDREFFKTSAK